MLAVWNSSLIPPEYLLNQIRTIPPKFDLNSLGFPKLEIIKYGLKQSVIFYERYDAGKYINPVCRIVWKTIFDSGVPKTHVRSVSWKLDGKGWSVPHKSTQPIRNPKVFLQKMRGRIIEELIELASGAELGHQIKSLYEQNATLIYIYKEGGSPKFAEAIKKSKASWLERSASSKETIRDVILQYLSIGAEV